MHVFAMAIASIPSEPEINSFYTKTNINLFFFILSYFILLKNNAIKIRKNKAITGIEPILSVPQTDVLPLNYTFINRRRGIRTLEVETTGLQPAPFGRLDTLLKLILPSMGLEPTINEF